MNKSRRVIPTVLPTILEVPLCAHLEPKILSNLLSLQEKNWQNSRLWRDKAYSNGHLCREQVLRCWWLKYQQAVKRCVCICFLMMGRGGREASGREVESFLFGAQTSQYIFSQTQEWGQDEDWALKTEDFWAWKISSWTLSHWRGGTGLGISVCLGDPSWGDGWYWSGGCV